MDRYLTFESSIIDVFKAIELKVDEDIKKVSLFKLFYSIYCEGYKYSC